MDLLKKGATVALSANGPVRPGDIVHVTVKVTGGKKDLHVDGGAVKLVFRTYAMPGEYPSPEHKDRRHEAPVAFIGAGVVAAGSAYERTVTLIVPPDAPPSSAADESFGDSPDERGSGGEWIAVAKLDGGWRHQ